MDSQDACTTTTTPSQTRASTARSQSTKSSTSRKGRQARTTRHWRGGYGNEELRRIQKQLLNRPCRKQRVRPVNGSVTHGPHVYAASNITRRRKQSAQFQGGAVSQSDQAITTLKNTPAPATSRCGFFYARQKKVFMARNAAGAPEILEGAIRSTA